MATVRSYETQLQTDVTPATQATVRSFETQLETGAAVSGGTAKVRSYETRLLTGLPLQPTRYLYRRGPAGWDGYCIAYRGPAGWVYLTAQPPSLPPPAGGLGVLPLGTGPLGT